jgi:WD repeat-containing protein 68
VSWCRHDPNLLATFCLGSNIIFIVDIRMPSVAAAELRSHKSCVNDVSWSPHSSTQLLSAGEDKSALIWDFEEKDGKSMSLMKITILKSSCITSLFFSFILAECVGSPVLHYESNQSITSLQWSPAKRDWVAATTGNQCLVLRV